MSATQEFQLIPWKRATELDIHRLVPERCQLDFSVVLGASDEIYELHFKRIFTETYDLMNDVFGIVDFPGGASPWTRDYPDEFYRYVEAVAQQDPRTAYWDRLLRFANERVCLLQAIVFKILDEEVFSSLCFGSDTIHEKTLQTADELLLSQEGFDRSSHRADTNKLYLAETGLPPPLFWDQVDRLTARIIVLLLPLYNLVGESSEDNVFSVSDFLQGVHDIVAQAGLLNIMIRFSPSIVAIDWVKPGDIYEFGHVNFDDGVLRRSESKARRYDLQGGGPDDGRRARVKISVAPKIRRYTLEEDGGEAGYGVYKVMEPCVVYYQGLSNPSKDEKLFITLKEHIRLVRRPGRQLPHIVVLVVLACLISFFSWSSKRQGHQGRA